MENGVFNPCINGEKFQVILNSLLTLVYSWMYRHESLGVAIDKVIAMKTGGACSPTPEFLRCHFQVEKDHH